MPSTVIRSYEYDEQQRRLRVHFLSGAVYDYLDVPPKLHKQLKEYRSKGTFLNRRIKGHYRFEKVTD